MFGNERDFPALSALLLAARTLPRDGVVEVIEHILGIEAKPEQQRGDRQLALAVDPDVDDILGVEFEIEPRTAIGNDAGGEQELAAGVGLAAIMIEQHARRTVHLADDHAFGAVDDKGAVLGHERHVAHVDVLLLDIEHGAGFGFIVHFEHDQPQRHLHRRSIGDAALAAFGGVELRRLQFVMHEIKLGRAGEIANREHRTQRLFEARDIADRRIRTQELLVALALHLDQVRHFHDFVDVAENLADALGLAADCFGSLRFGRHDWSRCLFLRVSPRRVPEPGNVPGRKDQRETRERPHSGAPFRARPVQP